MLTVISTPRPASATVPYVEPRPAGWLMICPRCHRIDLYGYLSSARAAADQHTCKRG